MMRERVMMTMGSIISPGGDEPEVEVVGEEEREEDDGHSGEDGLNHDRLR
jgi:hypothetical protein